MSTESWHPTGEPMAIYYNRLRSWEQAREYIDAHVVESYQSISAHLADEPDVPSLRSAHAVVQYMAGHEALEENERIFMALRFNNVVHKYRLGELDNASRPISLIEPLVELRLTVDDLAEVR